MLAGLVIAQGDQWEQTRCSLAVGLSAGSRCDEAAAAEDRETGRRRRCPAALASLEALLQESRPLALAPWSWQRPSPGPSASSASRSC